MVAYAETVGPEETHVLPVIEEDRKYFDFEGNEYRPEDKVDMSRIEQKRKLLSGIPTIGDSDPHITMPIKKIVSDRGEVIADADRDAKFYLESSAVDQKKSRRKSIMIGILLLLVVVLGGIIVGLVLF